MNDQAFISSLEAAAPTSDPLAEARTLVAGLAVRVNADEESFGANLKRICPFVQTVQLAFDADWRTNEKVQLQMERLANSVKAAGLRLQILCWESNAKGYDDELLRCEQ